MISRIVSFFTPNFPAIQLSKVREETWVKVGLCAAAAIALLVLCFAAPPSIPATIIPLFFPLGKAFALGALIYLREVYDQVKEAYDQARGITSV